MVSNRSNSAAVKKAWSSRNPLPAAASTLFIQNPSLTVQAKLKVGPANDKYEQEADQVADRVMSMPESTVRRQVSEEEEEEVIQPKSFDHKITPLVQRQVEEGEEELIQTKPVTQSIQPRLQRQVGPEEDEVAGPEKEEEEEPVQAKADTSSNRQVSGRVERDIKSMRVGGHPLPESERAFFEPRFGRDFSTVRLHTDSRSAGIARSINARAFTIGRDVAFGAGQYSPGTTSGRRLMAHELVHVLQQHKNKKKSPDKT